MDRIYTVKETAKILGFSTNTVYKYLEEGSLTAARGGGEQGRFRIPHSSLEKFLKTVVTEEQVRQALTPSRLTPLPTTSVVPAAPPSKVFPLHFARALLIISLVFMILDLLTADEFSLLNQILRMLMIAIFILLLYQAGGYYRVQK